MLPDYEEENNKRLTNPAEQETLPKKSLAINKNKDLKAHFDKCQAETIRAMREVYCKQAQEDTETILETLTQIVIDNNQSCMSLIVQETDLIKSSLSQLSNDVSTLASIVRSSRSPHTPSIPLLSRFPRSDAPSTSRAHRSRSPIARPRVHSHSRSRSPRRAFTKAPSFAQKPTPSNRAQVHCAFCDSAVHFSKYCTTQTSLAMRLRILKDANRCLKCFRIKNHMHHRTCEPDPCERGCANHIGVKERHNDWLCPLNPSLKP
ncbi:hypothetical protein DXG03_004448 [Asterophora parasitica]|uniref:Uncharacterized protein n=1 Tax=Asterophora parasitica TaxID=117018 RepID=A0A9P7G2C6_9AGAR|nr:hypothetical protein DXG03_004448 [Asterophora parasitica]